ncbi:hypothetical protein TNCT_483541 [Trichonephila clavata]|uniref:Uncharacterized protein n=1 Tax=Trichonephila clavata TaxID=2740835 RepID=A0A8X6EZL9_TRICU|nr:hypothetical protein TNCT_483541 [Trichonephila clavata]
MRAASPAIFGALPTPGGLFESGARGRLRKTGDPKLAGISAFRFGIRAPLVGIDRIPDFREDPASGPVFIRERARLPWRRKGAFLPYLDKFREYEKKKNACARPRRFRVERVPVRIRESIAAPPVRTFRILFPGREPPGVYFFRPRGRAGDLPRSVGKKNRGPSSSLNVFRTVSKSEKKHPSAPLHGKVAARSGNGPEIRKGGTRFHPGCGFRRSRTSAGVQVGTLERSGSAELRRRPGGPRFRSLRRAARFPLRSESRLPLPVLPETFKSVSNFLEINFFFLSFFSFSIAGCYVKTRVCP